MKQQASVAAMTTVLSTKIERSRAQSPLAASDNDNDDDGGLSRGFDDRQQVEKGECLGEGGGCGILHLAAVYAIAIM